MARLGQHPRLAHLVLKGRELGQGKVAALLAAILSERDFLRLPPGQRDVDLRHRVDIALSGKRDGALRLIQESARRLMPRDARNETPDSSTTGALLALAYPDRIGRRRPATAGRYLLSGGRGAALPEGDPRWPTRSSWSWPISTARPRTRASSSPRRSRRPRSRSSIADRIVERRDACAGTRARAPCWRAGSGGWARWCWRTSRSPSPIPRSCKAAMLDGMRQLGLRRLPWSDDLAQMARSASPSCAGSDESWPDLSDAALLASLRSLAGAVPRRRLAARSPGATRSRRGA